jgi:hypothetical protein
MRGFDYPIIIFLFINLHFIHLWIIIIYTQMYVTKSYLYFNTFFFLFFLKILN